MNSKREHKIIVNNIVAGFHAASDKLILERMTLNMAMIIGRGGKVQKISPFVLAEERWGKEFVTRWREKNKR